MNEYSIVWSLKEYKVETSPLKLERKTTCTLLGEVKIVLNTFTANEYLFTYFEGYFCVP